MSKVILLVYLLLFTLNKVSAQDITPLIKVWKIADTSQTHAAEETYAKLNHERKLLDQLNSIAPLKAKLERQKLAAQHKQTILALNTWLDQHPNDRLKVRILMYDILGRAEFWQPVTNEDKKQLFKAIELAERLKDDQLKAELYALYGQLNFGSPSDFLLYNLKAVELQRKIGFQHFSYVHNRFFNISYALFHSKDYKESISFGRECLGFKNKEQHKWDPRVYIFQLDMIGASYLKLGKCDSAIYFYRQVIDTLSKKPDEDTQVQRLWLGIANGNIGHALILQGHVTKGLPLVQAYLQSSLTVKSYNNVAQPKNILASVNYKQKKYSLAKQLYHEALKYAIKGQVEEQQIIAIKGIADSYLYLNQADSSHVYNERYQGMYEKNNVAINAAKLDRLRAQMTFDNLKRNYNETNHKLATVKLVRNFTLMAVVLLAVIALLVYNRNAYKAKFKETLLTNKQQEAERQMLAARAQVVAFSKNILEKDRLIYSLNKALKSYVNVAKEKNISGTLVNYVLVTDQEWVKFKEMVSNAYPGFFVRLESLISHITPAEERLASLICLQLNDRQMANMLGISKESVARSKRRLKQRILIPEGQTLEDYIYSLNGLS